MLARLSTRTNIVLTEGGEFWGSQKIYVDPHGFFWVLSEKFYAATYFAYFT